MGSIWRHSGRLRVCALYTAVMILCVFQTGCASDSSSADQELTRFPAICSEVVCRPTIYASMRYGDGERIRLPVFGGPYVHAGRIHVLRGEEFRVVPRMIRGEIVDLRYAGNSVSPTATFLVSLERTDDFAVLDFQNPFSGTVLFRAAVIDSETYQHSDERICSIGPQEIGSGRWFRGIDGVVIYSVNFMESVTWPSGCW